VAARSKGWVCDRSLAGIAGSNPTGEHAYLSLVSVVYCQVEVSVTVWSWILVNKEALAHLGLLSYGKKTNIMHKKRVYW